MGQILPQSFGGSVDLLIQEYPAFTPFLFYEKLTLLPVFANLKKFDEDFPFHEKSRKSRLALSLCFAAGG